MTDTKNEQQWERTISFADGGTRLDKFWGRELADEGVSRGRVKAWIESGLAKVNGRVVDKGKYKLAAGEKTVIGAAEPEAGEGAPDPVRGRLDVLFEDAAMLMVCKPAGLTTHPAPGEPGPTLVNLLLHRWPDIAADKSGMDEQRPGIVHRLDKDTSGVMAVARTEAARLKLSADFAEHNVFKVYLALVHGVPTPAQGTVDAPMGRHPSQKTKMAVVDKGGREARSDYRVLWTGPRGLASLVAVRIHTGRTHQIRVHMAHIGHPLLGDAVYGPRESAEWERRPDLLAGLAPRQMLHAFYLSVFHPETGEPVTRWLPPPEDFCALLAGLPRECLRVGVVGMPGGGKSALMRFLGAMGRPCFSADECVAELYNPGGDGAAMINQRFGGAYTLEDGGVDKPGLFAAMRESDQVRREVNDMVHPMVRHRCEEFFKAHRDEPVAYAEVPLLLEGGWHKEGMVDLVAGVRCPADKRTGELRRLRNLPPEILAVFDSWQWPEKDKLAACDFVADNSAGLDHLEREAERLDAAALAALADRDRATEAWMDGLWPGLAGELDRERAGGEGPA
ncbi:dephospho-CoA kinase [Pseudodesulfovibrio indicus]|jgi:23S rRNA pseudouridine1911/1915/1917 synthase|uniref:Dephospho-CoA kinase n=1 Tax=Pseudodesulfovibrio indicus TaxID=1716143 RepID=A0A126QST5_9BACT|nr:dephospho-CoA kinase [Pseudodesulfovibrio indicus]AMK13024.1 dephospho-CoA kinase [Pseudodesulfovibrio indicus]TDT90621.1 23S rRNA pseudouridine1911/1915/1917 synthase [Pseudodesulfovibrio indicus]